MYTECPNCHTFFKVTPNQLKLAGGRVRCGNCNEVFNAVEALMEEVPASALNKSEHSQTKLASEFENEVEILDEGQNSFADVEIPGTEEAIDFEDSSLSGLAGSEPVSTPVDNASLSDLSELSDLSDLSMPDEAEDSVASAVASEAKDSGSVISDLSDIDIDIDSTPIESEVSAVVSADDTAASESVKDNLSDINRDIDNALDGLFDEDFDVQSDAATTVESAQASKILEDTDLTDIPDLPDSEGLMDLDINKDAAKVKPDDFELDLSDEPYSQLDGSKKKSEKKVESGDELDDFELGDSLLSSDLLDSDESDWTPAEKSGSDSEMYSGDSFILEELDDGASEKSSSGVMKGALVFLIVILMVVLAGQFIYLKREALVKYPQMLPILELECKLIGMVMPCEVPARKALDQIDLLDRNVVSHPNAENALLITTTIKNIADFNQPFPNMVLTFSDINEKLVARRTFTPEEYLAKDVSIEQGMEVGVPVKVILEIVDPGEEAVNFQFDFK